MLIQAILIPVFVLVAVTFALLLWSGALRSRDVRSGAVDPTKVALREPLWLPRTQQVGYAYANALELPLLFYALVALLIETKHADLIFVILAWVFVLARLVQAGIHVTANDVRWRGAAFGVSVTVLALMWLIFAVQILTLT